jgi:heat shock protein HtpX
LYSAIAANKRNTVIIITIFVALIGVLAWLFGEASGNGSSAILIILFAAGYALFQYYAASSIALSMSGAQQIQKRDNPRLWNIVENLAISQGMPMPKVYIINDPAPNAFATGRNPEKAVVAATTGLLEIMDDNELEGVMAHELGHVKNYDIRVSMIVFGLISAIGILADFAIRMAWYSGMSRNRDSGQLGMILILVGVVGWIIAALIGPMVSAAVSRQREYLADASGAAMTRYPDGLASALKKLGDYGRPMQRANSAMAHMYINDPLKPGMVERAFSTHPPIPKRIERLKKIGSSF